ncbi:hypothetical protein [Streptomyces qinzhouensis]|uniref:Chaplin n=1 Tax=Streptomyces qinzhouensis TaxID=2599401 RepID=A0A5B8JHY9_9ACTN|nr:hypothetical protein [Streptomyces qinzhouensis]QDY79471.1 hypothetical protein FQU76_26375 [Streptomyces qinzhouensis]
MRIRTALAALALTAASVAGTAATAAATEFGDITITTEQHAEIAWACNDALLLLSPSVQCGVFNIAPQ